MVAATLLVASSALALVVLARERAVRMATGLLETQTGAIQRGDATAGALVPIDPGQPARALLPRALARAQEAARLAPPARRRALDESLAAVDLALARRPGWGDAAMVRAFVLAELDGRAAPSTRAALAASYAAAPYLRDGAAWRIGLGVEQWQTLAPQTRDRVIDEAVWHIRTRPRTRAAVFDLVRGTPAYVALVLRYRIARSLDDDMRRRW